MAKGPGGKSPAGLKILIPGYAQWSWSQRERAAVLFGSFAMALSVAIFAWGTPTGLAVLAFAFAAHVVSAVDVVRQGAFPGFGRWMPLLSASGGLAFGVYGPALGVATLVAWPARGGGAVPGGYLVNCWAYHSRSPVGGDWVWMRSSPWSELRVGQVVAGPGQEVEWSGNQLRIDGTRVWISSPFRAAWTPDELTFKVPDGHVLVNTETAAAAGSSGALQLIPREQIAGRAWARSYPLSERRLLP